MDDLQLSQFAATQAQYPAHRHPHTKFKSIHSMQKVLDRANELANKDQMFTRINAYFVKRPLLTNMATTGLLFGSGDVLAQTLFPLAKEDAYDYLRTLRVTTYGGLIFAPIGVKWYGLVSSIKVSHSTAFNSLARVAADQLLFAPILAIPMYYSCMSILEMRADPVQEVKRKMENLWWPTLVDNWTVWPAFQFFNFALVPVQYKLLAVNVFSIGWNCYLSYVLHRNDH